MDCCQNSNLNKFIIDEVFKFYCSTNNVDTQHFTEMNFIDIRLIMSKLLSPKYKKNDIFDRLDNIIKNINSKQNQENAKVYTKVDTEVHDTVKIDVDEVDIDEVDIDEVDIDEVDIDEVDIDEVDIDEVVDANVNVNVDANVNVDMVV
jgi:hypothetical protein